MASLVINLNVMTHTLQSLLHTQGTSKSGLSIGHLKVAYSPNDVMNHREMIMMMRILVIEREMVMMTIAHV